MRINLLISFYFYLTVVFFVHVIKLIKKIKFLVQKLFTSINIKHLFSVINNLFLKVVIHTIIVNYNHGQFSKIEVTHNI